MPPVQFAGELLFQGQIDPQADLMLFPSARASLNKLNKNSVFGGNAIKEQARETSGPGRTETL